MESVLARAGFVTMDLAQDAFDEKEIEDTGQWSYDELIERVSAMVERPSEIYSHIGRRMLEFLKQGRYTFTRPELTGGIVAGAKQSCNIIGYLRRRGYIVSETIAENRSARYRFNLRSDQSEEVLALVHQLANSRFSLKDRRIGEMVKRKLGAGHIDIADYRAIHELNNWQKDMELCVLLGLVTRETDDRYRINRVLQPSYAMLKSWQKNMASALYDAFGTEVFTFEMIVANLDYSETTSATLHAFTLLGILDCAQGGTKEDCNIYQFLVTPEEHPECFRDVA